jgi:DNA-binding response OmpR family regulator
MVVDADAQAAARLVERVQRLGYEAVCFTRTAGVVNAIIDHRPDWLLVDVDGAATDGPSLCELLRSAPMSAKLQMLLVGARPPADARDLVLRCRAQGYLQKDPSADGVAMKLDALIRRRVPLVPVNERERLAELRSYNVLDTAADEDFDGLTRLASHICGTPVALMSPGRQW